MSKVWTGEWPGRGTGRKQKVKQEVVEQLLAGEVVLVEMTDHPEYETGTAIANLYRNHVKNMYGKVVKQRVIEEGVLLRVEGNVNEEAG